MTKEDMNSRLTDYLNSMEHEERSEATIIQYNREIRRFLFWLEDGNVTKEDVIRYKEDLTKRYKASSVNAKLAAINGFFAFLNCSELKVKQLKIQRQAYCSQERELTKKEYFRLVAVAKRQENERLAMLLQTICGTGIRVSELQFITVEAVEQGEANVRLKGKIRTILIPETLCRSLKNYICQAGIASGPVFVSRTGKPMDRSSIWKMMKGLCKNADVDPKKVFPHNLRHLFARCFYGLDKDIARLADILGHSSINTTRLYIISTGEEHCRRMDELGLVFV